MFKWDMCVFELYKGIGTLSEGTIQLKLNLHGNIKQNLQNAFSRHEIGHNIHIF